MRIACLLAVLASTRPVAAEPSIGTIASRRARWVNDTIITEYEVVTPIGRRSGRTLGGSVDGIGVVYLDLGASRGDRIAARRHVAVGAAAGDEVAAYGVQRANARDRVLWRDDGCLELVYDEATVSPGAGQAIDAALATWNHGLSVCSAMFLSSRRAPIATRFDGVSSVHVRRDRWCVGGVANEPEMCFPPSVIGVTRLVYIDNPGDPDDGKILEADIDFNAVHFELIEPGAMGPFGANAMDLQSVATHEIGHVLGLAHNCATGDEEWPADRDGLAVPACEDLGEQAPQRSATMYFEAEPESTAQRSLEPADVLGACSITRHLVCEPVVVGGCRATGSTPPWWLALTLAWPLVRRRRITARAGRRS